jgi:alkanesulfonate monooxygenase SsuD/methylene tetrahydromethanopterin reductase-like flavin-dependent oxidoreductase (luciferase family)
MDRVRIPIVTAGLRPKMIEMAGERGDGWIGFMCPPGYIKDVVMPRLAAGAEREGRDVKDVKRISETICSVHEDRSVAFERARAQVGMYACHPVTSAMVEHLGLEEDRDALLAAVMQEGPQVARTATSDALVAGLSITGTPDEVHDQLGAYEDVLDHIILHTPYVPPLTPDESADAFRNILAAFSDVATERGQDVW